MYARVRSRDHWEQFPATRDYYYVTTWPYEHWERTPYTGVRYLVTRSERISDDAHRGLDRGINNLLVSRRTVGNLGNIAYPGSGGASAEVQSVPWYYSSDPRYFIDHDLDTRPASAGFGSDLGSQVLENIANMDPASQAMAAMPFIGELRQTIRMVRNPLSFLTEAASRFRKQKGSWTLAETLRNNGLGPLSGGWLAYNYGWKPLMGDLSAFGSAAASFHSSYATYVHQQKGMGPLRRATATASDPGERIEPPSGWTGIGTTTQTSHTARCILWFRFNPTGQTVSASEFLRRKLGLTSADIIPTVWELVPWSFVVDWFIPVGKTLSKVLSTPADISVVKQQYDHTMMTDATFSYRTNGTLYNAPGKPDATGSRHVADVKVFQYERHPYPFMGQDADPDSSWLTTNRAITAFALIAQKLMMPISKR